MLFNSYRISLALVYLTLLPFFVKAQRIVTGRILDVDTQTPVVGSIVSVNDIEVTKTNALGFFKLKITQEDSTLFIVHHQYGEQKSLIPNNDSFVVKVKKKSDRPTLSSESPFVVLSDSTKAYFDQIQKGDERNMGPGRDFCDLKIHFLRKIQIIVNSDEIKNYTYKFSFNPIQDKVEYMSATLFFPNGENKTISGRKIKTDKGKNISTKSIYFPALTNGVIIKINYELVGNINNIPPVILNDTIPKLKCYFNINIPDYVKFRSNYDSVAPPVRTTYPGAHLRSYHPTIYYNKYGTNKPYYTTWEPVPSTLLIWNYEDLRATAQGDEVKLIFEVTDIALVAGNTYGLVPKRILTLKR